MSFEKVRTLMEESCDEVSYYMKEGYIGKRWPMNETPFYMRGGIFAHPKRFPYLEGHNQVSLGLRVDDFYTIVLGLARLPYRLYSTISPQILDRILDEYTGTHYQIRRAVQQSSLMQTEEMYHLTACLWLSRIGFELTHYFQRATQFELNAQDVKRIMADDVSIIINREVWHQVAVGIHRVISVRVGRVNIEHVLQELQ